MNLYFDHFRHLRLLLWFLHTLFLSSQISAIKIELKKERNLVFIVDVIASEIDTVFPGLEIVASYPFRITRNAEITISNDLAPALLTAMVVGIESRL